MSEENSRKWSCMTYTMLVLTCLAWSAWVVCRLTYGGLCARPSLADNYTDAAYIGYWHQQFVAKGRFDSAECVTATYAPINDVDIQVNNQSPTNGWSNWNGTPPAGEPSRYFTAQSSAYQPGKL